MVALRANDICYSTVTGWDGTAAGNPFNTDGVAREKLDPDFARTALDFEIGKYASYDEHGRRIPKQYHLRRSDDNSFIESISVGEQYTPIQHADIFDYITQEVMPEIPEMELEMCGTIHGGGVGLIAARFGSTFAVKGDESPNNIRLFFANKSNNTGRTTVGFTTVRVRCENTLLAASQEADATGWRIYHKVNAATMTKRVIEGIRKQAVAALEMKASCQRLAEIGIDSETFKRFLDSLYPIKALPEESRARKMMEKVRESVVREFEEGSTAQSIKYDSAWKMFNAATYHIFNPEKLRNNTDRAEIQYKGMTGSTAKRVRRIYDKVISAVA